MRSRSMVAGAVAAAGGAAAAATIAAAITATGRAASHAPAAESDAALLETLVALRLERVFERVLQEPRRDPLEQARYRVRMARAEVVAAAGGEASAEEPADPARLRTLVDRLMAASADLIAAFPDHPAAGEWRLDLAEDAWRWLWSLEAAGMQVHLGMPEDAVRRRAIRAAELIAREVPAAAERLDFAIEQLEFSPGWPGDAAIVREHRRLVEQQRDGRLRVLRRIAAAMRHLHPPPAAAGDAGSRAMDGGAAAGTDLEAVLGGVRDLASERAAAADGVTLVMRQLEALLLLRGQRPAEAAAAFDEAVAAADEAGDAFSADLAAIGADHCRAREHAADERATAGMDRLRQRAASAGEPGFLELLAADAAARAGAAVRRAEGIAAAEAERRWRAGLAGWAALADRDPRWFAFIRGRFAATLQDADPLEELPPVARLGRADALLEQGRTDGALELLGRIAADERVAASVRGEAWRTIARGAAATGDVATAARAMLAASTCEPDAATARASLDAALRLAASIDAGASSSSAEPPAAASGDPAALRGRWPATVDPSRAADPLMAGVRIAAEADPDLPELDRWRAIAAARLIASGRDRDAARLLEAVAGDGAESSAAVAMQVAIAHERLREVQAGGDASAVVAAASDLRRRLREAGTILAAGRDADGRLAGRLGGGRGSLLAAEAELAVGRATDALARLGLWTDGEDDAAFGSAIASSDAAVAAAAADLAVRAMLAAMDAAAANPETAGPLRAAIQQAAAASPRAATALVQALARRVEESAATTSAASTAATAATAAATLAADPTMTIHATPLPADPTDPLVLLANGLHAWLSAPGSDVPGAPGAHGVLDVASSPAIPPAVLAIARRDLGRLAIASGRLAEARAWFDAVGGLQSSDPAVLLGAADARVLAAAASDSARTDEAADLAAAMAVYRRLAADREAAGPVRWWTAQLRMLQILDRTGRNLESIGPRIERLRLEDPAFGYPRLQPAFEALAARHVRATPRP